MRRKKEEKIFLYSQAKIFESKVRELENVEEQVVWLLHHYPKTRNSDLILLFKFWNFVEKLHCSDLGDSFILTLTPAETITRCRRHIQNDLGLFLPTHESVIEVRNICQEAVRSWAIREGELNAKM